ncbi:hypothetical protein [Thermosynechococcus sp.]|uniref:hypothetical protein n=1 Tax=Thermosynechococcus sp. TaxID=2814275 RepID=UPI00391A065D
MAPTTPVDGSPVLLNVRNATVRVTPEQFDQFCRDNPDLRLELTKAGEATGARLGLLINSQDRQVELYPPQEDVVVLNSPEVVDCSEVMPGFFLPMTRLWV